ncbi:acyl-CoA N-acyltransferase [Penicillium verhagenii]|nr:acyl-CoA N-acyltransferase [Penicillium verhagenii]
MPKFNITPLSPESLSPAAQTFFESWRSLPRDVEIPSTPLNTLVGCRERLEQMLSQPDTFEVLVANPPAPKSTDDPESKFSPADAVLGFVAINKKEKALDQLFVHPDAQNLGLGGSLLDLVKARFPREDGGFWLRTAEGNLPACGFYEKRGLRMIKRETHPVWGHWTCIYAWQ